MSKNVYIELIYINLVSCFSPFFIKFRNKGSWFRVIGLSLKFKGQGSRVMDVQIIQITLRLGAQVSYVGTSLKLG